MVAQISHPLANLKLSFAHMVSIIGFYWIFLNFQKRMEENKQKLVGITTHLLKSSTERRIRRASDSDKGVDLLTKRQKDALDMQNGINVSDGENDRSQEDGHEPSAVLLGSNVAVRNAVRPIKLPEAKTLPPYTTWIFLDRFVKSLHCFFRYICYCNFSYEFL